MSEQSDGRRLWIGAGTFSLVVVLAAGAWMAVQPAATGVEIIEPATLLQRLEEPDAPLVLDVRSPAEYAAGHVPGAVNIPYTELAGRLDEVRAAGGGEVVVYCQVGGRAAVAEGILAAAGFDRLRHLQGDMRGWQQRGLPLE